MIKRSHITIQNIAISAGVSKTTVSRFLNAKYEYMSEATRKNIEDVILRTGYRPNKIAGSLKTAKSDLIGLVLANPAANLTPFLIGSICDSCTSNGQKMIVVTTHDNEEREREQVLSLLDQQVDGLIVTTGGNNDFYTDLDARLIPVVLADRISANSSLDWVAVNHYEGTAKVINFLIEQGYEYFVSVTRATRSNKGTIAIREQSVEDICQSRFGDQNHSKRMLVQEGEEGCLNLGILDCIKECYSKSKELPTAIFIADGILMGRFVCGIYKLGLDISDNFTLGGYDIWNFGCQLSKEICTIDQPLFKLGTIASDLLISRLENKGKREIPNHILLDCKVTLPNPYNK